MRGVWLAIVLAFASMARAEDVFVARAVETPKANEIRVQLDRWRMTVRLHGVEPPEAPIYGRLARAYLRRRVEGTRVRVEVVGTAARGVVYGNVYPSDRNESLNHELIRRGLGLWSERYAPDRTDLRFLQNGARAAGAGLWGGGDGRNVALPPFASRKKSVAPRPPKTPTPTPSPSAAPRPVKASPAPAPPRGLPAVVCVLVGAGLLAASARVAEPVRRVKRRPVPLGDSPGGLVRVTGIARPLVGVVSSAVGRIPGLYVRERTWRFNGRHWGLERDDAEGISFLLEDGTGSATVAGDTASFFPVRIARFYNEVPVEQWYERSYPGDTRTEVHYLPAQAPVTVVGVCEQGAFEEGPGRIWVLEGDPRRLVGRAMVASMALTIASGMSFVAALVLSYR